MKTLQLFREQSCQVFNELKRFASNNAVFRYNQKAGKSVPKVTTRKVAENPHKFICLFVGIKPEKLYLASCVGREVNPWK